MSETLRTLEPWLIFLAGPVGAGALGSWLFARLRLRFPRPASWPTDTLRQTGYWLLYHPFGALLSALTISGLISIGASVILAALTGANPLQALDTAFAALVGALASQLAYRAGMKPPEARA